MSEFVKWAAVVIFILALIVSIIEIVRCLAEESNKTQNRKRGNLQITVDKGCERRFKNKKN